VTARRHATIAGLGSAPARSGGHEPHFETIVERATSGSASAPASGSATSPRTARPPPTGRRGPPARTRIGRHRVRTDRHDRLRDPHARHPDPGGSGLGTAEARTLVSGVRPEASVCGLLPTGCRWEPRSSSLAPRTRVVVIGAEILSRVLRFRRPDQRVCCSRWRRRGRAPPSAEPGLIGSVSERTAEPPRSSSSPPEDPRTRPRPTRSRRASIRSGCRPVARSSNGPWSRWRASAVNCWRSRASPRRRGPVDPAPGELAHHGRRRGAARDPDGAGRGGRRGGRQHVGRVDPDRARPSLARRPHP